ncbi:MAG: hypothetical protein WC889_02960 [Myxococcota bacterium]|jgi:hypothetical protein
MNAYTSGSFNAAVAGVPCGCARAARLLTPVEAPRWNPLLDELVASGALYVMTYDDFVDRFGLPRGVVTDAASGERTAYHGIGGIVLDTPLCGGCDAPVSRGGYCIRCDEDHADLARAKVSA